MSAMKTLLLTIAVLALPLLITARTHATTPNRLIEGTPHNLSVTGGKGAHDQKADDEVRICIFCHTPHHATEERPLWSRGSNLTIYVPYASTTIEADPMEPKGVSRLCLSCHDGAIAHSMGLLDKGYRISNLGVINPADSDPKKNSNFGNDLTTSHPISMTYGLKSEFNDKSTLATNGIKLSEGSYVECTSCHDPHNNSYGNFLVRDTSAQHDALCTNCHRKAGWDNADSAHRTGGGRYDVATVKDPVAADGCVSCHMPHTAQSGVHLLKKTSTLAREESNCIGSCHKGAAYTDIEAQLGMLFTHRIESYSGHVQDEDLPVVTQHVQCVDCHNPHQAGWQGGPLGPSTVPGAPAVSGALRGVRGVSVTGIALPGDGIARYEFEICLKCHAGSGFKSSRTPRPVRVFSTYNQSERFAMGSFSYHPVSTETTGRTGRSLLDGYVNTQFRIYCSDCHAPHGSNEPYIVRTQNSDSFPSGAIDYPLCFSCHDKDYLDPNSAKTTHSSSAVMHQSHVWGHQVPCSACHDPHGVPALPGATTNNAAHLVNFDTNFAGAGAVYNSGEVPADPRSCTVAGTCHKGVAQGSVAPTQTY